MKRRPARTTPERATADARVAALLRADPGGFTAARAALAAELAAEGEAALAALVKRLRRPTRATALLNQLSAERPEEVARLLEAGERLRQAQTRALRGGPGALREASDAHRDALAALVRAAEGLATGGGRSAGAALLGAVERGLRAAAAGDSQVREALRAGALEREPEPPGIDLLAGLAAVPPPLDSAPAPPAQRSGRADPVRAGGRARRARAAPRAPRDDAGAAERRRRDEALERERRAGRARADEEVASALRDVEAAEKALAEARRRLGEARRARERI